MAHRTSARVQDCVCGALMALLTSHAENKPLAQEVTAIREVVATIRGHPDQPAVQGEARAALQLLREGNAG